MRLELEGVVMDCGAIQARWDLVLDRPRCALFGPSGSGKTSLLEAVAGLRPSVGRIALDGRVLQAGSRGLSPRERGLGYVPQDLALFPHLDVAQNLAYGRRPGDGPAWDEVVEALGLAGLLAERPRRLSGGEQRRVALARALLSKPRLLLLDEPSANLDAKLKAQVRALLGSLRRRFGVPYLLVSHDAEEIRALCAQVACIDQGRCVGVVPARRLGSGSQALSRRPGFAAKAPALGAWWDALC